jgi:hypothetical protein
MPSKENREALQLTTSLSLHEGPASTKRLPPVLPAGQIPGEQSGIWFFTPAAVRAGEKFIQDDTRAWFRDRDFKVEIKRSYPDHPRWLVDGAQARRAAMANGNVTAEIHMLVRIHNDLPEFPGWVNARMAIKATQADLSYKLTKAARETFIKHGATAMEDFALKAPAQFIKFIAATFVPKKIEVQQTDGSGLDSEERTMLLKALADELKLRQEKAVLDATVNVIDYEPQHDIVQALETVGENLNAATGDKHSTGSKPWRGEVRHAAAQYLDRAVNVIDHAETEKSIYAKEGAELSIFDWES